MDDGSSRVSSSPSPSPPPAPLAAPPRDTPSLVGGESDADALQKARGVLLGIAVGDAFGLPFEGLSRRRATRACPTTPRYRLLGDIGIVSDDTEQSVLLLTAVLRARRSLPAPEHAAPHHKEDEVVAVVDAVAIRRFRRSLVGWFWRLPWGIGLATLRACLLMTIGVQRSGRFSGGNGAAMRSAVLALAFDDDEERRSFARLSARPTHTDPRAVEGAVFCAELTALCLRANADHAADRAALVRAAVDAVDDDPAVDDIRAAVDLGLRCANDPDLFRAQRATGFVLHTLAFGVAAFVRDGHDVFACLQTVVRQGDDTDTVAAIVGGWLGALHGVDGLPPALVANLGPGPFGREHLEALARAAVDDTAPIPDFSAAVAMLRNVLLMPVILAHGFRRLWPF